LPKFVGCMMHQTDLRGEKGRNPERLYLVAHLQRLMSVRPTRPLPLRCIGVVPSTEPKPSRRLRSGVCVLSPISLRWRRHREELESCGRRRPTRPSRTTTSSATASNRSLLSSSSVAPRRTGVPGTKTLTPPLLTISQYPLQVGAT